MGEKIRITKEFRFEMAHALHKHNGLCKNVHGHSYMLSVTIIGQPIQNTDRPDMGMVIDFGDLKKLVRENIVNEFDHALVLSDSNPMSLISSLKENFEKIHIVDYQPTSELLLLDFVDRIKNKLKKGIELHHLTLRETGTSFAEWYASDND